jgi:hypothetical protein
MPVINPDKDRLLPISPVCVRRAANAIEEIRYRDSRADARPSPALDQIVTALDAIRRPCRRILPRERVRSLAHLEHGAMSDFSLL